MENIQIKEVMERFVVIINGIVAFVSDSRAEAIKELKSQMTC